MALYQSKIFGIVQGVGFRPFVARLATRFNILGSVCNKGPYVEVYAQGSEEAVDKFLTAIEQEPPERASILKLTRQRLDEDKHYQDFQIIESAKEKGSIFVSPDIATCDKCRAELFDPQDKRYLHPFINCTACGPRLTILDSMPYDRERTSMGEFPMCPSCQAEYDSPSTRRYDAQPVCCNDCGPQVYLIGREQRSREAIRVTRRTIEQGGIAAVKGIGGFHLCCDATSQDAVMLLRKRKRRPVKPFAVMMRDMDTVERECYVSEAQRAVLTGHQKPIVLLKKKPGSHVCDACAPGNPYVGVMLPYAPVQLLLFDYPGDPAVVSDCLVMTSANTSGAPICRDDADAVRELSGLCDVMLSHDRLIRIRADDTVMDFYRDRPYMIRRSRGYAPLPVMSSASQEGSVLAIGGELKNTFCIGRNQLLYLSPYIGDMEDVRTGMALRESVTRMEELLETRPQLVVCDMHPGYHSREAAQEIAEAEGLPLLEVQHHYAHILSCMAENDRHEKVIGVSFDGTGYGTDATIWGGELMIADEDGFERKGSIRPFWQVGGDASAREGWRIAVSMLWSLYGDEAADRIRALGLCDEKTAAVQRVMQNKKINTVLSTSAGRLFDAVSALLGICLHSTFEGEAATSLQFAAEKWEEEHPDDRETSRLCLEKEEEDGRWILPTDRLFAWLAEERLAGSDPGMLASAFHAGLAQMIAAGCRQIREESGLGAAALSGGVFQNRLLLDKTVRQLEKDGFTVLIHQLVPPNDGGIALGQAVAALQAVYDKRVTPAGGPV